jgi:hypothetical protein
MMDPVTQITLYPNIVFEFHNDDLDDSNKQHRKCEAKFTDLTSYDPRRIVETSDANVGYFEAPIWLLTKFCAAVDDCIEHVASRCPRLHEWHEGTEYSAQFTYMSEDGLERNLQSILLINNSTTEPPVQQLGICMNYYYNLREHVELMRKLQSIMSACINCPKPSRTVQLDEDDLGCQFISFAWAKNMMQILLCFNTKHPSRSYIRVADAEHRGRITMSRAMMHDLRINRAVGQYYPFGNIHCFRDKFNNVLANSLQCEPRGCPNSEQGVCVLTCNQANMLMDIIDFWFDYQAVCLSAKCH